MVIFEPSECNQYKKLLPQIMEYDGPVYVRQLRKEPAKQYLPDSHSFDLFKADILKEGKDISIFASGIEVEQAMIAAGMLEVRGISAEVINVHTIKPLDRETILTSICKTKCAVVCENHNIIGGLGSGIAELIVQHQPVPMGFIGIRDRFGEVGKLPYLLEAFQMDGNSILKESVKVHEKKWTSC